MIVRSSSAFFQNTTTRFNTCRISAIAVSKSNRTTTHRFMSSSSCGITQSSSPSVSMIRDNGGGSCHGRRKWTAVRGRSLQRRNLSGGSENDSSYTKHSDPAPGSPFHLAFPVHDLGIAKNFYGDILGLAEGRSSEKWQDYSLNGHQIVCHWVGNDYRCQDYFNPVDGDEVPVPHFGLALTEEQFHSMAERIRAAGIKFIIEPHLRFKGEPGEQYTMFFKDPSGNNLEFKAMTKIDNLFAKYNVADE